MRFSIFIFFLLLITSCFHGNRLDEVKYDKLFHGGQSRIWMIGSSDNSENQIASQNKFKNEILLFSSNGNVILTDFSKLYYGEGKKGTYSVYSKNKEIDIRFQDERWFYTFEFKNEHHIVLKPNVGSSTSQTLELIALPEI